VTKFQEAVNEAAALLVANMAKRFVLQRVMIDDLCGAKEPFTRYGKAQFAVAIPVRSDWLDKPAEHIVRDITQPMTAALADKLPPGVKLINDDLELPKGCDQVAMGRHAGVAMRGVCTKMHIHQPVHATWLKNERLYDVSADEFVTGPASFVLRFDVVEKGPAQMSEKKRLRGERNYTGAALQRAVDRT
jgi:hypothetical protein